MTTVILLMAGLGSRLKASKNKMLVKINDKPLYFYILEKFKRHKCEIILVVSKNDYDYFNSLNLGYKIVIGGASRQESVLNGLKEVRTDRVLIHDGARILLSDRIIDECLENDYDAYFVATKVINTIRYNKDNDFKTLNRDELLSVQTPQGGKTKIFLEAALQNEARLAEFTDDISMLIDVDINVILGDEKNIKVTTPNDLSLAKFYLEMEGLIWLE